MTKEEIAGRQDLKIGKILSFVWSGWLCETVRPKGGGGGRGKGGGRSAGTKRSWPGGLSLSHDHSSMPVATRREQTEWVRSRQGTQDGEVLETFRKPFGGSTVHGKAFNLKSEEIYMYMSAGKEVKAGHCFCLRANPDTFATLQVSISCITGSRYWFKYKSQQQCCFLPPCYSFLFTSSAV